MLKNVLRLVAVLMVFISLQSCDKLAVKDTFEKQYELINQHDTYVTFPGEFAGNVLIVGYVYTNCPDICPVITYNMRDLQRAFADEENFSLVSISFDPERDTPDILFEYAEGYNLNQSNWHLLTGEKNNVDSVLEKLGIATVKTPTRFTGDNTPIYFIDHTDKVTLIDREGKVRNHYLGSELKTDEAIEDIKKLLSE